LPVLFEGTKYEENVRDRKKERDRATTPESYALS
jgi:hypothetical protein